MKISDLGEFPLIDRVAAIVGVERADVVMGIGDDVAILDCGGNDWLLAKVDSQVEGTHYRTSLISPRQLGRRALAINLSDIAAVGGQPTHALVSLALRADTDVAWVDELYRGLREEGARFGVVVVGGNMASSPGQAFIDVFVLGSVGRGRALLRSGARPGDLVMVSGWLGDSAAGLRLLLDDSLALSKAEREPLLARHLTPVPRLAESAVIADSGVATAMIDLSDGLSSDIGHVCQRSAVGVRLWEEKLPISAGAKRLAELCSEPAWRLALNGGEDYELCFTAPAADAAELAAKIEKKTDTPITVVGEMLSEAEGRRFVLKDGREIELGAGGWDHFAAAQ